jgi:hypothetical protein
MSQDAQAVRGSDLRNAEGSRKPRGGALPASELAQGVDQLRRSAECHLGVGVVEQRSNGPQPRVKPLGNFAVNLGGQGWSPCPCSVKENRGEISGDEFLADLVDTGKGQTRVRGSADCVPQDRTDLNVTSARASPCDLGNRYQAIGGDQDRTHHGGNVQAAADASTKGRLQPPAKLGRSVYVPIW